MHETLTMLPEVEARRLLAGVPVTLTVTYTDVRY